MVPRVGDGDPSFPQTQGGGVQSFWTWTGGKDTDTIIRFFNNGTQGGGRGPILSGPPPER